MSTDGNITDYHARVDGYLGAAHWAQALPTVSPSPKFKKGQAITFPGVTLMTPAGPADPWAIEVYTLLEQVQESLTKVVGGALIQVPSSCFHVTVADLLAGPRYDPRQDAAVADAVQTVLGPLKDRDDDFEWNLAGIGLFEHAVVGLLRPQADVDYAPMVALRDRLYRDLPLRALGVRRPRPLMVHVTLGYFRAVPREVETAEWVRALVEAQLVCQRRSAAMSIGRLALHRFDNMAKFRPLAA